MGRAQVSIGDHEVVPPITLTARARAVWESLAGVQVAFAPVVRVAVSSRSALCPPGWAGLVVIDGAAIVTAPDRDVTQVMQEALGTVPVATVTDVGVLGSKLEIADMLGPATLAYLDREDFRPQHALAVIELPDVRHPELRRFLSRADAEDLGESGIEQITSPAFVIREHAEITAVAGYRDWPGQVAHLSVLTAGHTRGRGLACATASAAVSLALGENKLPQWRARPEASRRIARRLGFRELGSQVSIRLGNRQSSGRQDPSC
jgi:RimJ/RimL family protein N-acetyltransferase